MFFAMKDQITTSCSSTQFKSLMCMGTCITCPQRQQGLGGCSSRRWSASSGLLTDSVHPILSISSFSKAQAKRGLHLSVIKPLSYFCGSILKCGLSKSEEASKNICLRGYAMCWSNTYEMFHRFVAFQCVLLFSVMMSFNWVLSSIKATKSISC